MTWPVCVRSLFGATIVPFAIMPNSIAQLGTRILIPRRFLSRLESARRKLAFFGIEHTYLIAKVTFQANKLNSAFV
jgi:hypothetical protein